MPCNGLLQGGSAHAEAHCNVLGVTLALLAQERVLKRLWSDLQVMYLKYQLPSEPSVYVDLLDDEDVSLMFDEVRFLPVQCCCKPSACRDPPSMLGSSKPSLTALLLLDSQLASGRSPHDA